MGLDPQAAAVVATLKQQGLLYSETMTVAQMRASATRRPLPPGEAVDEVAAFSISSTEGPIQVRRYRPRGAAGITPLVVYFHGGG